MTKKENLWLIDRGFIVLFSLFKWTGLVLDGLNLLALKGSLYTTLSVGSSIICE